MKQWTRSSVTFQFPVSDSFLVKNCRCLVYSSYGQLRFTVDNLEAENVQRSGHTNEQAVHNTIYKWQLHSQTLKICPFQVMQGTPVVLTHTHARTCKVKSPFNDTGALMRGVAYKTKLPATTKKYFIWQNIPFLKFDLQRSTQKRSFSKIKDNVRKTRLYSGLRNKMSQGVPYIFTANRFSVQT
jgi:hypothetical protein